MLLGRGFKVDIKLFVIVSICLSPLPCFSLSHSHTHLLFPCLPDIYISVGRLSSISHQFNRVTPYNNAFLKTCPNVSKSFLKRQPNGFRRRTLSWTFNTPARLPPNILNGNSRTRMRRTTPRRTSLTIRSVASNFTFFTFPGLFLKFYFSSIF
jgi:hypothetical protein